MKKSLLTICVVLLGLPCVALAGSSSTVAVWCIEEADANSAGDVITHPSLALDGDGKAHISYSVNGDLQYTTNKSGTWEAETVDATENTRFYSSLALDTDGKVHISYWDGTNENLKYATNMSGDWVAETVDGTGDGGSCTSLALDAEGKAHISYYDSTNQDLKYATNMSGDWVAETVDSTGAVGFTASLALNAEGKVHISYYDSTNRDLKYATNMSGDWVAETVDSTGYVGSYTSLAIDAEGKVHISYWDGTNENLKYATNESGIWVTEMVDDYVEQGGNTSLALDAKGKAHIGYYDDDAWAPQYATNKSGAWVHETVSSIMANEGQYTSLALDAEGSAHISYNSNYPHELKYAYIDEDGDCIHRGKTTIPTSTTTSVPANEGFCGDATINGDEECDGSDLGGETCESLGLIYAGILACEEDCTFDMSGCYTSLEHCGNGTLDPGEDCDTPGVCCSGNCTFRPEGALCSDGELCNGQETCDGSGMCNPGIPVDCDDGISCTDDFCDPDSDTCVNIPDDSVCPDDGLFCNGDEICSPHNGCGPSNHSPCRCAIECNEETDTCDPLPQIYFYRSDFLEEGNPGGWDGNSLKSFEDVWTLSLGETVEVDMWLTDLPEALLTSGFIITYNSTQVNITNVIPNDTNNGGPWEGDATSSFEVEPGLWFLVLLAWRPFVTPDEGQDILLARVTFERVGTGNAEVTISTIPEGFDTVVGGNGYLYDCQIPSEIIIINDGFEISGCCGDFNLDNDVDGSDAAIFKRDYGRSSFFASSCTDAELCYGDFDCDTDVDGNDAYKFKVDFGRSLLNSPCQGSVTGERCTYP